MVQISAVANLHLTTETQNLIQNLSFETVRFHATDPKSVDELVARTGSAEIVLVNPHTIVSSEYLKRCSSVRHIGVCGTSVANLDIDALVQRNVTYSNINDYGDEPAAEFIFMQLVSLLRGVGGYQWKLEPHELMNKTLTIVGLGALGQAIARLAVAYRMHVQYFSRTRREAWERQGLIYGQLNDVLANSDIVVLSVPTNNLIMAAEQFMALKPGAVLLQASIGVISEDDAFRQWIARDGNFAIFDYSAGQSLYLAYKDLDRVIFPQIFAAHTIETRQRMGKRIIENIENYLRSQPSAGDPEGFRTT